MIDERSAEPKINTTKELTDKETLPEGVVAYSLSEVIQQRVDQLDLPSGYGLIGGGARAAATEMLCGRTIPVRDIDIAAFNDYSPDQTYAHIVAQRLMPDDYTFGHGVQFSSLEDYFGSRDFTISEVAVMGDRLLITDEARHDLQNNVIRPTLFEHNPDEEWYLSPKLAIKSVLMQSVLEQSTDQVATIEGVDLRDYRCDLRSEANEEWVRPFFVALGFQKALEYGENVATAFLDKLISYGMILADSLKYSSEPDERLAAFAKEVGYASDFEFRGVVTARLAALHELMSGDYALGDLLHAVGDEEFEQYVHYHELALSYGGKGRGYIDESQY